MLPVDRLNVQDGAQMGFGRMDHIAAIATASAITSTMHDIV